MQGIYRIDKESELLYVGQSVDMALRWSCHKSALRSGSHSNMYLQNIANKHGVDKLSFSVIEEVSDKSILTEREQFWIDELSPRCNMQIPCDSGGWSFTEETKKKISEGLKGKPHNISPEGRRVLRENRLGKSMSEESRRKVSESKKGVRLSDGCAQVKHPTPEKNWLVKQLSLARGGSNLALKLGISKNTVKRWCAILDVPFNAHAWGKPEYQRPAKNKLISALIFNGYHRAANTFSVSPNVVKRWCKEYDIPYKGSDWSSVYAKSIS